MKTQFYTATSLDGYLADENHSLDWLFQFGGMETDSEVEHDYSRFIAGVGAAAMGATTYEWVLEHEGLLDDPAKWPYDLPTWVFTHRDLPAVEGADLRFVEGDVAPVHAEMAEAADGKNIWLLGGGDLVGQFHDRGLLDEIILNVAPVTLGAGAPLLPRRIATPPLKLTDARSRGGVFVVLTYEVQNAGEDGR